MIHETSIIGSNVKIGPRTRIWQFCNIMDGAEIGSDCNIGQNVYIESGVKIGNRVKIKNNISIYEGVTCEDGVFLGPNVVFTNVINPRAYIDKKNQIKPTQIQEGATVGAGSVIVCGYIIGRYSMIGAGSVVTHDVYDYELVYGNPAIHKGWVCECGERLDDKLKCDFCGKRYELINSKLLRKLGSSGMIVDKNGQ